MAQRLVKDAGRPSSGLLMLSEAMDLAGENGHARTGTQLEPAVVAARKAARKAVDSRLKMTYIGRAFSDAGRKGQVENVVSRPGFDGTQEEHYNFTICYDDNDERDNVHFAKLQSILLPNDGAGAEGPGGSVGGDEPSPPPKVSKKRPGDPASAVASAKRRGRPPGSSTKRSTEEGEERPTPQLKPRTLAESPHPPSSPAPRASKPATAATAPVPRVVAALPELVTAEGVFRTAGAIVSLRIVNFMCHANFYVRLGPHANFGTGKNGSGKSAILTALSIALGLKKSGDTNRGKSFKDFIRRGAAKASVAVTLANVGRMAYKPTLFGPTLTIKRVITPSNAASFTLTGASGHVLKGPQFKQVHARALADRLQIDCLNPCVCMNQDQSRSFLHSGKDTDKYDFFMQASQLDHIQAALDHSRDELELIRGQWRRAEESAEAAAADVEAAAARLHAAGDAHRLQDERCVLGRRLLAAIVAAARDKLAAAARLDAEDAPKRHAELAAAVAEAATAAAAASAQVTAVDDAVAGAAAAKRDRDDAERRHKAAEKAAKAAAESAAEYDAETQGMLRRAEAFTQEAASRRGRHAASQTTGRAPLTAAHAAAAAAAHSSRATAAAAAARAAVAAAEADAASAVAERNRRATEFESAQADHGRLQGDAMHARRGADAAAAAMAVAGPGAHAAGRAACRFGAQEIGALLAEMARSRARFGRLPVGPLGSTLELTDAAWAPVTELALGTALDLFACDSMEDERELRACAARAGYPQGLLRCVVYSHANPPYVLPPHAPAGHPSLLSLLRCSDDVARNVIIDRCRPEDTVLFPDAAAARRALFDRSAPRSLPHAAAGFDPSGTQYAFSNGAEVVSVLSTASEWAQRHFKHPRIVTSPHGPGSAANAPAAAAASHAAAASRASAAIAAAAAAAGAVIAAEEAIVAADDAQSQARRRCDDARSAATAAEAAAAAAARAAAVSAAIAASEESEESAPDPASDAALRLEAEASVLDQQAGEVRVAAAARAAGAAALAESATRAAQAAADADAARSAAAAAVGALKASTVNGASTGERLARAAADASTAAEACVTDLTLFESKWARITATLPEYRAGLEAARASLVARIVQDSRGDVTESASASVANSEEAAEALAAASADGDDRSTARHVAALISTRERLLKRAARAEAMNAHDPGGAGLDVPALQEALAAAQAKLEEDRTTRAELRLLAWKLIESWKIRRAGFNETRRLRALDLTNKFNLFMGLRGHGGRVVFDHPESDDSGGVGGGDGAHVRQRGSLSLVVRMREKGANGGALEVKDTKSLSGGERSFASLALMLAIGTDLDMPFRAMDEPDIFMDPVNRRIALTAIMKYANEKENTQFIFLTPQDLSQLDNYVKAENPIVKVFEIAAAR